MLIYSPPGAGKTTLLRDISVSLASPPYCSRVVISDERNELYIPEMYDIPYICAFCGYPRGQAVEAAVRSASPDYIISDEIGSASEAEAMLGHIGSGVSFIASAHASSLEEVMRKPSLAGLHGNGAFALYCGVRRSIGNRYEFSFTERSEAIKCLK